MKKQFFVMALLPLLVFALSPALVGDAEALKAKGSDGTQSPKAYGSNTNVCGDRLCSELMYDPEIDPVMKNMLISSINMNIMMSNMEMLMSNMNTMDEMGMIDDQMMMDGKSMLEMMLNQMMDQMMTMMTGQHMDKGQ